MFMNKKSGTAGFYGGDKYSDAGGDVDGCGARREPVSRYDDDACGEWETQSPGSQEAGELVVLDGVHRASVADEKDGHPRYDRRGPGLGAPAERSEAADGYGWQRRSEEKTAVRKGHA
jgi:hypothetical protein